jgi:hypothetical protein
MERASVSGRPDRLPPSTYLWIAPLAPALVWLADLQVSYFLVHVACVHQVAFVLPLTSAIAFTLALAAGVWAWRRLREPERMRGRPGEGLAAQRRQEEAARAVHDLDWRPFLLLLTVGSSAMFALVIVANAVPRFVLDPCVR